MPIIEVHNLKPEESNIDVYNGLDCMIMAEVWEKLKPLEPQAAAMYRFERALQGPTLEMMLRGFRIDPIAREKSIYALRERLERLTYMIDAIAAEVWPGTKVPPPKNLKYPKPKLLNPESTVQLQKFFYEYLHIPPIVKSFKGKASMPMDRETLETLETYFIARPIIKAILEYRDTISQLEVFESEVDQDWRMRTSYGIATTDTTRFSSSKSIIGSGRNLQNIEESLRYVFISDPGMKLYGIDLEQAESREVGLICGLLFGDWSYLDACESGDLHTTVAKMVWPGLPWKNDLALDRALAELPFEGDKSFRDATKVLGHGSNYLGKPYTMSLHTKIPVQLCNFFQRNYFVGFPCLPQFHHWVANEIQTKRSITNVFGWTRDFFDRTDSDETLRAAVASVPQSQTAQRLNLGMWRLWRHMPEAQLLAQLHDAVYFQVPEDLPEHEVAAKALSLLEIPQILPNGRKFVVPGEVKCGYNWSKFHVDKNPMGLKKIELRA